VQRREAFYAGAFPTQRLPVNVEITLRGQTIRLRLAHATIPNEQIATVVRVRPGWMKRDRGLFNVGSVVGPF
jgi:hypothetical protein